VLAAPALAQTTPQTGNLESYARADLGAAFNVKQTVKWNADISSWKVDYSVTIDLGFARSTVGGNFGQTAEDELGTNIAKYEPAGGPWYQMRYANTNGSGTQKCATERAAAYNSEMIGGTGWSRSFFVAPGEKTCLSVWMYGENVFTPHHKGTPYNSNNPLPMGVAYFVAPAAP